MGSLRVLCYDQPEGDQEEKEGEKLGAPPIIPVRSVSGVD